MKPERQIPVRRWDLSGVKRETLSLVGEAPLILRIDDRAHTVLMRTPGDETAHAAGFSLCEGLIEDSGDIAGLTFHECRDPQVVDLTRTATCRDRTRGRPDGIRASGDTNARDNADFMDRLCRNLAPIEDRFCWTAEQAVQRILSLGECQPLRRRTRATHAAALFSSDFERLTVAEDVGRHNALDKVIGTLLLAGRLERAAVLLLSSRISHDLVQKAARARVAVILSVSRPTSLGVALAARLNLTLACLSDGDGLYLFDPAGRLRP